MLYGVLKGPCKINYYVVNLPKTGFELEMAVIQSTQFSHL